MKTAQVKNNPKYQKNIDRSFQVIYHNLKRIRDNVKPDENERSQTEASIPHPQAGDNSEFLESIQVYLKNNYHAKEGSIKNEAKRVSFSVGGQQGSYITNGLK